MRLNRLLPLALLLLAGCGDPVALFAQGAPESKRFEVDDYYFDYPAAWNRPAVSNPLYQAPNTDVSLATNYGTDFYFVVYHLKLPYEVVSPSLDSLCELHHVLNEDRDWKPIDESWANVGGETCCYSVYQKDKAEFHEVAVLRGNAFVVLLYGFENGQYLVGGKEKIKEQMKTLMATWHWKHAPVDEPSAPLPSPAASGAR